MKTGDKLWYVPRHGESRYATVEKVGIKYFTLEGVRRARFWINTLRQEGSFTATGRCYHTSEEWSGQQNADAAWAAVRKALLHQITTPPIEWTTIIAETFGIELPEATP